MPDSSTTPGSLILPLSTPGVKPVQAGGAAAAAPAGQRSVEPSAIAMTAARTPSGVSAPMSAGLGDDADVGLRRLPLAEELLGLVVRDRTRDDDVLALLPVRRRGHLVLGRELQGVDHPQDLVEVAARAHRVH